MYGNGDFDRYLSMHILACQEPGGHYSMSYLHRPRELGLYELGYVHSHRIVLIMLWSAQSLTAQWRNWSSLPIEE